MVYVRENHKKAKCHPDRRHAAKGMCFECYAEQYPKAERATCHPDRLRRAHGLCKSCYDKKLKARNPEYAERQRRNSLRWTELNAERKVAQKRQYYSQGRVKQRDKLRDREASLLRFGLTIEDEVRILEQQGNRCGICGGDSGRGFDIDHDHATGRFRGLICHRCNKGLGLLGDDIAGLEKALAYLRSAETAPYQPWRDSDDHEAG
ncbi:endonuclease domain-containing protein [Modicisalibacter coralii]|uniref:endonuclease domain-containing protein n=1 Tax=Modicisalibacter coralii TaxID=2304602 RepID=UPI00100BBEFC